METLHPEPVQTDLGYVRVKRPPRGGINLYVSSLNGHLTTIWVVKFESSTPRHWCPCLDLTSRCSGAKRIVYFRFRTEGGYPKSARMNEIVSLLMGKGA
jgi:hypothetical protein